MKYLRLTNVELATLLICSTRYALRRSTYIVLHITGLINQYAKLLNKEQREIIKKDISQYLQTIGENDSEYDIKQWRQALEVLK